MLEGKKPVPARDSDLIDFSADPEQEWRVFLNGSKTLSDSWGSDQMQYAKLCHAAVEKSLQKMDTERMTARSLYEFLAGERRAIAEELMQPSRKRIGLIRSFDDDRGYTTPIMPQGKYRDFFEQVQERIKSLYTKEPKPEDGYIIEKDTSRGKFKRGDRVFITDGDLVLTGFNYPADVPPAMQPYQPSFTFVHTYAEYIPKIYEKVDKLFASILEHPEPTKENMQKIGEMAWYLAHAMPCQRGSAATTELFARTMMKKIGLPIVPYEHPVPLDFEALIEPDKTKFIERFTNDFYPNLNKYYEASGDKEKSQHVAQSDSFSSYSIFKTFKEDLNKIVKSASEILDNWSSAPKNK